MNSILDRAIDSIFQSAKENGIKAIHIAEATGLSNSTISLIRHKKKAPEFSTLEKLAVAAGTSLPIAFMKVLVPEDISEVKRPQYLGIEAILKALINSL